MTDTAESDDENPPVLVGSKVPLTLLTGYLGAGKSTLIKYILTEEHGRRIAVIMNEFSDTSTIESLSLSSSMIKSSSGAMTTPLLSLPNGCLCCSARSDDFAAIQELVAQRGAFDYIILETTGVADPGVVAETFWQNEEWDADVRLDGVICVVDGMWGEKQANETPEIEGEASTWERQIACSDAILLNKVEDSTPEDLDNLTSRIESINPTSPIHRTTRSRVSPLSLILDLKAYSPNPDEAPSIPSFSQPHLHSHPHSHSHPDPDPGPSSSSTTDPSSQSLSSAPSALKPPRPSHLSSIHSTILPLPPLFPSTQYPLLIQWIQLLIWAPQNLPFSSPSQAAANAEIDVLRLKGLVWSSDPRKDGEKRKGWVIQGVRGVYEVEEVEDEEGGEEDGKLVVIGKGGEGLEEGLRAFLELDGKKA